MNNENQNSGPEPTVDPLTVSREPQSLSTPAIQKPKNKKLFIILLIVIGLLLLGAIAWGLQVNSKLANSERNANSLTNEKKNLEAELEKRKETTGENDINKEAFQSVFLKSGQVYFGKITRLTETQIKLENIYYLRINGKPATAANTNSLGDDVQLVKLGNELHGPQDVMFIERKEVEFWENLKADGQVAKAITEYEKQNPR